MRRAVVAMVAVVMTVVLTGACAAPRNTLGTAASPCFRALPTARAAVHNHGRFLGVRRIGRRGFTKAFHTDAPPGREFCAVGFSGAYRPGEVDHAPAGAAGHYAVITVTMRGTTVLRSFVVDHLPLRLGHR